MTLDKLIEDTAKTLNVDAGAFRKWVILTGLANVVTKNPLQDVTKLGKLYSISYIKKGTKNLYEHEFEKPRPNLIVLDGELLVSRGESKYNLIQDCGNLWINR